MWPKTDAEPLRPIILQQLPWEEMRWSASQLETMWRNLQERNIIRHTDERRPMYDSIPFLKWLGDSLDDVIVELVRRHGPSVLDWLQAVVDNAIANAKVKLDAEETT